MIASMLRAAAAAWLADGGSAVVVEVIDARGSVPRGPGTRMLVGADETAGTIGGGHLELKAIAAARAMLARNVVARREERYALGPTLGQCCGGAVSLAFERLDAASLARWPASAPLFHLQLHGAGHVGRAIATVLATLDCRVDWFDERDEEFPETTNLGSPWPSHIRIVSGDTIESEVRSAPPGAFYLVMTHEHALDQRIAEAILARGDFALCGVIGSKTKRVKFTRRFAARGIDAGTIERMTCPIGMPAIDGREPEIIAVAVVAQLLQVARQIASVAAPTTTTS